jgi:hypothetical protein
MTVSGQPNLKELERRAWRSMHEDGLWELFLGTLLLVLYVTTLVEGAGWQLGVNLVLTIGLVVLAKVAKRTITIPRMGVAKFGHARRQKRKKTTVLLLFSAVFGAGLAFALGSGTGLSNWMRSNVELFNVFAGAWVLVVFGGMAYWLDLPRLLFVGLAYALVFSHILPVSTAMIALVGGTITTVFGLIMLIRFMRKYPLPNGAELHDNG